MNMDTYEHEKYHREHPNGGGFGCALVIVWFYICFAPDSWPLSAHQIGVHMAHRFLELAKEPIKP